MGTWLLINTAFGVDGVDSVNKTMSKLVARNKEMVKDNMRWASTSWDRFPPRLKTHQLWSDIVLKDKRP